MMTDDLIYYATQFPVQTSAYQKITAALSTLHALKNKQLPQTPLPPLSFSESEILTDLGLMPIDDLLAEFRQTLITDFGIWHLPNQAWLLDLHQFIAGRQVLEIMCGNAIITHALRALGDSVIATDNFAWQGQDIQVPNPWTKVTKMTGLTAIQTLPFDVVIMSWAPDTDTSDADILMALRQQHFTGDFIVIGEKNQATNSKKFWHLANLTVPPRLNHHHKPFDFIHDQVFIVK
ncbi:SAM-dependent methyltransferase [Leuconostoc sp. MS02]|uniref:SAM-dependent methyltransferase n=1 Tax=Leuconostoc aquikimchii TaxID=3236804 RepID=A0ABV3S4I2_9LACO